MEEKYQSEFPKKWLDENDVEETTLSLSTHRTFMASARSHMANERTHLSYLRTSLSLMTFGITLNRFSIFFGENKTIDSRRGILIETAYVGIAIVLIGLVILAWALRRYRQVSRQIENDTFTSPESAMNYLTLTVLILGGICILWMLLSQ